MAQKPPDIATERRAHRRRSNLMTGQIEAKGQSVNCAIYNLSASGALITSRLHLTLQQEVELVIPDHGAVAGKVARVTSTNVAIAFLKEEKDLAQLSDKARADNTQAG